MDDVRPLRLSKLLFAGTLPAMAIACGCQPLNSIDGLYGRDALPALREDVAREEARDHAFAGIAPLDRSHWEVYSIRIQRAQVEHQPTYRTAIPIIASSARADGKWPTVFSAVSTEVDGANVLADGALEPLGAAVDVVLLPFLMIGQPPGRVVLETQDKPSAPLLPENEHAVPWRWVKPYQEFPDVTVP
jgi:hypothetical protein